MMIVGAGIDGARHEAGYMPRKDCWTDSRARVIGVERR